MKTNDEKQNELRIVYAQNKSKENKDSNSLLWVYQELIKLDDQIDDFLNRS